MSAEDNKALIRRFYDEIDQGNLEAIDELVTTNYVDHSRPPFTGVGPGREGLKQSFSMFWDATPGRHEIEDQIAEGGKVVPRLTAYGVHERVPGIPATGRRLRMTGTAIHRIENGKIAEKWSDKDALGLLQQLGVMPKS